MMSPSCYTGCTSCTTCLQFLQEAIMNAKSKIHQMKPSKWMAIFQEQKQSNLSIKDWCSQNNISRHAFYYWRKIATESYMDSVMPDIVPIAMSHPVSEHELSNSRELYNLPDTNTRCHNLHWRYPYQNRRLSY